MTDKVTAALLFLVGIINVIPITVFFAPSKTVTLYGLSLNDDNLTILMRHRGVLLAIVGATLIFAAFKPEFRIFAITLALISKFAFIFLTFTSASYAPEIRQVALIDVGAILVLVFVLILQIYGK